METSSPMTLLELLGNLLQRLQQHVLLFCLYVRDMLWVKTHESSELGFCQKEYGGCIMLYIDDHIFLQVRESYF